MACCCFCDYILSVLKYDSMVQFQDKFRWFNINRIYWMNLMGKFPFNQNSSLNKQFLFILRWTIAVEDEKEKKKYSKSQCYAHSNAHIYENVSSSYFHSFIILLLFFFIFFFLFMNLVYANKILNISMCAFIWFSSCFGCYYCCAVDIL